MKRCSTCTRTFTDQNLSFCIDDGTPLTEVPEDEPTVVAYRPPAPYTPPGTLHDKKRSAWPWIVGIVGAFFLGVIALTIAAAVLVPRLAKQAPATTNTNNTNTETTTETPDNKENVNTPAPTDEAQVLSQLKDLENEWMVANINADKKKLARILADDYVGDGPDNRLQGKAEYIRSIERDTETEKWDMDDLKLDLAGDRATLSGKVAITARSEEHVFDFKDKFVWRDGRWQATGSELKRRE